MAALVVLVVVVGDSIMWRESKASPYSVSLLQRAHPGPTPTHAQRWIQDGFVAWRINWFSENNGKVFFIKFEDLIVIIFWRDKYMELYFTAFGGGLFFWLLSSRCKMKPPVEVAMAPHAAYHFYSAGYSALHTTFTAPKYIATVRDALTLKFSNYWLVKWAWLIIL
jgi:hypothetical protein